MAITPKPVRKLVKKEMLSERREEKRGLKTGEYNAETLRKGRGIGKKVHSKMMMKALSEHFKKGK